MTGPYAFHLHAAAWLGVLATGLIYLAAVRRVGQTPRPATAPTRGQWWYLAGGLLSLAVALTWPLADLAAHWSLTALLLQRLLLTLAAAPLLLLALPSAVIAAVTRPAPLDRALEVITRPAVAVVLFTTIAVGTLFTPVVAAQASSSVVRGVIDVALLFGGGVLWGPVLRHIPGASRPSPVGLAAYLFVQSIVPGFPSVIYVFARHPLYPAFAHVHTAIGLSPVADQQLAGVVAKVATLPVLWSVAWLALARAARDDARGSDSGVLTWAEVERQLERAERRERRAPKSRHLPRLPLPPRLDVPPVTGEPGPASEPPGSDLPGGTPGS
ncbi:MAG TPA: cytochrome c oxidase assembly protein [Acidimicrobiales bacterium]|nr:cytochrome c oxidase assembly protein [Acidimicrobiales bacterium]